MDVTLYFAAEDVEDMKNTLPYDNIESALEDAHLNGGLSVWSVTAHVDFSTAEKEDA